jgi:hypothetical protein
MDFLDPKKRRAYKTRLIIGYVLMAIVIGLATIIIVYGANGYGINTKTGQVVQNGLLFVDSKPGGAEIFLNNADRQITTSSRLILPAGNYTLSLKKTGYRDWNRSFTLSEQSIARYVYPFLFPVKPVVTTLKTYNARPAFITQSPDRKWLLLQNNSESSSSVVFDEYDTSTLDKAAPATASLSIPANILTNYSASSTLTEVEWSTDNNNVLLRHDYAGGSEFIVFNRNRPDQSFNVNTLFNVSPSKVSLFNKKADQLYIYNQTGGVLQLATVSDKSLKPVLQHALAYTPYGRNLITYVTDSGVPAGKVEAKIWDSGQTYKLSEFTSGSNYLIDAAQFSGDFYYAVGSDNSEGINIYKNPESNIKDPSVGKALPTLALHDPGATRLKFSDNARFIGLENGQNFAVYDLETQTAYQYTLANGLSSYMVWMDGHRLMGQSDGNVLVMDYDGTNKQVISPTLLPQAGYFDRDYNNLLCVAQAGDGSIVLQDVDMRAGTDLPKIKQQ